MNKLLFINLVFTVFLTACSNQSLIGKWDLIEHSADISQACYSNMMEFTDNGELLISSSSLEMILSYEKTDYKAGMHLKTKVISDNGGKNCQGHFARKMPGVAPELAYAEFIKETGNLKLYFKAEAHGDYMLLKRK